MKKLLFPLLFLAVAFAIACAVAPFVLAANATNANHAPGTDGGFAVSPRELHRERRFFATVSYPLTYKVYALEGGTLVANNLVENREYEKGNPLVELKNDPFRLEQLQRRNTVLDAEQNLTRTRVELQHGKKTDGEYKKARESLEIAKGQLELADEAVAKLTTPAPFDGRAIRISAKLLKSGEQNTSDISKGDLLCEFVDNRPLVLKGNITLPVTGQDMADFRAIAERGGQKTPTEIISLTFLSQASGNHDNFEITLALPQLENSDLPLGTQVPVTLELPTKKAERVIPRTLVQSRGDLHYCLVRRGGKIEDVSIMLGEYDANYIEVFGNLELGEMVVKPEASQ